MTRAPVPRADHAKQVHKGKSMMRLFLQSILLLVLSVLPAIADDEAVRTLTSREGVSIKASVLKVENGQVTIRKEDGKVTTFPLGRLSDDDQRLLSTLETKGSVGPSPAPLGGKTGQPALHRRVYPRTIEEMKAECARIRTASVAQEGFSDEEKAALLELNIHRFLSGVPGTVELNRKFCEGADRASEGCAKIGELSHEATPEGKRCNLHRGQSTFAESVRGYIEDPGENNREHRGHRTWCLHPDLTATGFGQDATKHFSAMWVSDGSQAASAGGQRKKRRSGFHAWPGEGLFPVDHMKGDGWTVYPAEPFAPDKLEIRVFLLPQRLDRPLAASATPEGATEVKVPYQRVDTKGPWTNGTIVFEPEVELTAGKIYWISLKSGSFRMSYCVEFVADEF